MKCQCKHLNETMYIDNDMHGRQFAQTVYTCSDCGRRYLGERVYYADGLRGNKDPRQKSAQGGK